MAKLLVDLQAVMADSKKIPFGPTGHVGEVLSGREHRTDEKALRRFGEIVEWLAQMTFGQSDCDMPWAEVHVIDRTRNESLPYAPLPYSHKTETEEGHWRTMQLAQMNLAIAAGRLDTAMKIYEDVRRKREKQPT